MKRLVEFSPQLASKLNSLQREVIEIERSPQTHEAILERARLNVFMENLSKLSGGISAARAEGVIKSFYGHTVPVDHIDQEILGFYEANLLLNKMLENGFTLSKESILELYTTLSKYEPDMTEEEKTGFRKKAAYTHSRNLMGKTVTVDYALPENIESELDNLISDVKEMHKKGMNPLAVAAIFHVEFEAIHPFKDGNGRLGRLLIYAMLGEELSINGNMVLEKFILENTHKNTYLRKMNSARGVSSSEEGTLKYEKISEGDGDAEKFVEYFAEIYELALRSPVQGKTVIIPGGI